MQHPSGQITRAEIRDRLVSLICDIAELSREQITDGATLDEELRMESVAFIEIQVALEDEYQIEIDPVRVVELNEFEAIVDYIFERVLSTA